ncbi:hypothetical protein SKAU_G00178750 [Synaphobranchus kaupii]|uniref:Uncharacterized protein n=1 Tax=Synaphobranchus kaupii TaxID=118154 RepID=A0A9Q1J1G7_SYNKA|nr:hypothetical protein SKAU_G00178750 [Synaphobranchus kaupii]
MTRKLGRGRAGLPKEVERRRRRSEGPETDGQSEVWLWHAADPFAERITAKLLWAQSLLHTRRSGVPAEQRDTLFCVKPGPGAGANVAAPPALVFLPSFSCPRTSSKLHSRR